jgi:double-stranded uracil-DNA glycosylase
MTCMLESFEPVARPDARVLVLGSMPGTASLKAGAYYAHPRNLFWPFMGRLVGADLSLPYAARLSRLGDAGIALWDVLQSCEREGSLDSAIARDTARANDFASFLDAHPRIRWILFNGARAEADFLRLVGPVLRRPGLRYTLLPSTSPANASQRVQDKFDAWHAALLAAGACVGRQPAPHEARTP